MTPLALLVKVVFSLGTIPAHEHKTSRDAVLASAPTPGGMAASGASGEDARNFLAVIILKFGFLDGAGYVWHWDCSAHGASPNESKLSDRRAWRGGSAGDRRRGAGWAKVAGWLVAAAVTCAPVRCSAWLDLSGWNWRDFTVDKLSLVFGDSVDVASHLDRCVFVENRDTGAIFRTRAAKGKKIVLFEMNRDVKLVADHVGATEASQPRHPKLTVMLENVVSLKRRNSLYVV